MRKKLTIGILAHVDAGKTTLTERILQHSGSIRTVGFVDQGTAHTDRMDIERRRGISVYSTCAPVNWKGTRINIIDTPGHADFSGEVERVLNMADGALLIVDNTFLTCYYQRPLELGADLVVYSGTKYLCGHNDVICGFVVIRDEQLLERVVYVRPLGIVLPRLAAGHCQMQLLIGVGEHLALLLLSIFDLFVNPPHRLPHSAAAGLGRRMPLSAAAGLGRRTSF